MSRFFGRGRHLLAAVLGRTSSYLVGKSPRKRRHRHLARLAVEQFEPRTLLTGPPMADMMAVMNLVPDAAVTDTAVQNGNWTSPSTWKSGQLPANNANVLIPMGLPVPLDALQT